MSDENPAPKRKSRLVADAELVALAEIVDVMDALDLTGAYRVLCYLNTRYDWPEGYQVVRPTPGGGADADHPR